MEETDLMHLVHELKAALRDENIKLLRQEEYEKAQDATQLIQDFSRFEQRITSLLSANFQTTPTASSAKAETDDARDYPYYKLEGSVIVKVGLRRDKETTYEQRLPRRDLITILKSLRDLVSEKKEFEAKVAISRAEVPSYQVYLALGLLQELRFMENPRRGVYLSSDWRIPEAEEVLGTLKRSKP